VIAYKQPVTQPEIQEIRGVSCAGVIQTLLEKRLVTTAGRKQVIGRPILYRTSKEFMMRFGLSDLEDLPSLKEFEVLAREALGTDDGVAESAAGAEAAGTDEVAVAVGNDDTAADIAGVPEMETEKGESEIPAAESLPVEAGATVTAEEAKSETNADVAEAAEKAAGGGAS
jgi:segregation and condensation protein B